MMKMEATLGFYDGVDDISSTVLENTQIYYWKVLAQIILHIHSSPHQKKKKKFLRFPNEWNTNFF